jgi:hypothetical protein
MIGSGTDGLIYARGGADGPSPKTQVTTIKAQAFVMDLLSNSKLGHVTSVGGAGRLLVI